MRLCGNRRQNSRDVASWVPPVTAGGVLLWAEGASIDALDCNSEIGSTPVRGRDWRMAAREERVVGARVRAEEATLVVTTARNARALREHLGPLASAVRFADAKDWYASPRGAFAGYRDFAAEALGDGAAWLRVVGEPTWADRSAAAVSLWGRYESLINLA